jgi:hypothetical protein
MVSVRLSVWTKIGQCLEDSSSHCPFFVECFGGWGKGEPGEARGWGGQQGGVSTGRGGVSTGEGGGTGEGRARAGGARRVRFTLQFVSIKGMDEMFVRLDDGTNFEEAFFLLVTVHPD